MLPLVVVEALLWTARHICLQLLIDCVRAADSRTFWTAGINRPIRMAMIAMTTSNSMSVKPLGPRLRICDTKRSFLASFGLGDNREETVIEREYIRTVLICQPTPGRGKGPP